LKPLARAASMPVMTRWMPIAVPVKPAANERLPGSRSRGEVGIMEVGRYRKVVPAASGNPTRRATIFTPRS
jgi:hypothetical protein